VPGIKFMGQNKNRSAGTFGAEERKMKNKFDGQKNA
jgi:hypothetical protein